MAVLREEITAPRNDTAVLPSKTDALNEWSETEDLPRQRAALSRGCLLELDAKPWRRPHAV